MAEGHSRFGLESNESRDSSRSHSKDSESRPFKGSWRCKSCSLEYQFLQGKCPTCYGRNFTFVAADETPECRMILIGKTGTGKSSLGNSILGKEAFKAELSPLRVSFRCERETALRFNRDLQVVDTPGLFDISSSIDDATKEIARCMEMSLPGPHCFLIVMRISRFTYEDKRMVDTFAEIFGKDMFKYAVVVFTGKDELEHNQKTLEDFLSQIPEELEDLLTKCGNRVLAINNIGVQADKDQIIGKLLQIIDNLEVKNEEVYFSNQAYDALLQRTKEVALQQINKWDEKRSKMSWRERRENVREYEDKRKLKIVEIESLKDVPGAREDIDKAYAKIRDLDAKIAFLERKVFNRQFEAERNTRRAIIERRDMAISDGFDVRTIEKAITEYIVPLVKLAMVVWSCFKK